MKKDELLWEGVYISLYSSGHIGVSNGVGYVGNETDIKGLYDALKKYFEGKEGGE